MNQLLVIEDDPNIRESLAEMLDLHGFEVMLAENGKAGLRLASQNLPGLIITDIMMPEMDGFEMLSSLRKQQRTELVPVIVLTAKVELESKLKGLELGADDYLTKPFEFRELHLKINNLLQTRKKIMQFFLAKPEKPTAISQDATFLKKLWLLLDEHLENAEITIEFIARQLFMSPSTFQRRVKKLTGKSPIQVINEYKLKKAHNMIRINFGNLSEIANRSGFNSLSYFSASYKEYFGKSPSEDFPEEVH